MKNEEFGISDTGHVYAEKRCVEQEHEGYLETPSVMPHVERCLRSIAPPATNCTRGVYLCRERPGRRAALAASMVDLL